MAKRLATFVKDNNLDGVDVNYNDDYSISTGASTVWLKAFMTELRNELPTHIICHSVQNSYFATSADKGYNAVNT